MTRIFEALEQAQANRGDRPNVVDFREAASSTYSPTLIAKLRDLYRLINKECTGMDGKLVQFIGEAGEMDIPILQPDIQKSFPWGRILMIQRSKE